MVQKIVFKEKVSPEWEKVVTASINGTQNTSFYPKDGELYLPLGDETMYSLVIKKDGTWKLG